MNNFFGIFTAACCAGLMAAGCVPAAAQGTQLFIDPRNPAIDYFGAPVNAVAELEQQLASGEVQLDYEPRTGYLRSLLAALGVPVESQIAVYSKTSLQKPLITAANPRTIFFNDEVTVAWMAGGFIEVAVLDPQKGAVFYDVRQSSAARPRLARETGCLQCHVSGQTLSVPGFLDNSIPAAIDGSILPWLGNTLTDHRTPVAERWGGWYVTGAIATPHQGNMLIASDAAQELPLQPPALASLAGQIQSANYLTPYSDIVALLVFDHQIHMMNLLVRMGWEGRLAAQGTPETAASVLRQTAVEVVDYMLFIDEAPLVAVQGASGFTEVFNARGPFDDKGRSLRTLNLQDRLLQYSCSYMIYTEAFAALPAVAKEAVYLRMAEILFGTEQRPRYARLTPVMRREIVEILRATKDDLPAYFAQPFTQ